MESREKDPFRHIIQFCQSRFPINQSVDDKAKIGRIQSLCVRFIAPQFDDTVSAQLTFVTFSIHSTILEVPCLKFVADVKSNGRHELLRQFITGTRKDSLGIPLTLCTRSSLYAKECVHKIGFDFTHQY